MTPFTRRTLGINSSFYELVDSDCLLGAAYAMPEPGLRYLQRKRLIRIQRQYLLGRNILALGEEAPIKIRCPKCHRMIYSTSKDEYCARCGKKLPASSTMLNLNIRTSRRTKTEWKGLVQKYHLKHYVAFRAAVNLLKETLQQGVTIEKLDPHWV